ncbi:MAG TPA: alpha/beta hydrolase [Rhizomicrobium sp.]|jgi:pimeloyl-ACP methyl ester carboxylesterase
MNIRQLLLGAALAVLTIAPSFADQALEIRDRFSDEIIGNGPDIVFIPGLSSSRDTWKAQAARLKDRYRVHLIQVAGFAGETPRANASGPVLVPTAEAIDAYLVEKHLTPATIVGHSLGGTMVLYLAQKHPADIKKGMIVDSLPFYSTLMMGPNATVAQAQPIADGIRANPSNVMGGPRYDSIMKSMATSDADRATIIAWGKASTPSTVANAIADDMTLDLRPDLAKIGAPLTLVYPDYVAMGATPGSTGTMYRGAYAAVPGMSFVEAKNSLHFIMLDQPVQMDAALDAFLAK